MHRTTNSCVLGQTQRQDLKQVIKLEVFGTRLNILIKAQTQKKKNVHLYHRSKSLQWVDTSLGKCATPCSVRSGVTLRWSLGQTEVCSRDFISVCMF